MDNITKILSKSQDNARLKLPELVGEKVVCSADVKRSEIHIIDWLWSIYCSEDNGRQFLNRIINGGNILALSKYCEKSLVEPDLNMIKRKIKRIILAVGLEVCGISSEGLMLGEKIMTNIETDKLLYKIFYDVSLNFPTDPIQLSYIGTKKIFIRDMIPKLYTVPSKYRFLDTIDSVPENKIYASVENVKSELDKIYAATKKEFEEQHEDLDDDFFENIIKKLIFGNISDNASIFDPIIGNTPWYYQTVLVNDAQIGTIGAYDLVIILLSNIVNANFYYLETEFILLFFKNLHERTINYK